jgi:hypothetical protein
VRRLLVKLALVFGSQGVVAWYFYRNRVVTHASWTGSDLLVFGLPLLLGFGVSARVLFVRFREISASPRLPTILAVAAGGAVVSSCVSTVIAFNLYGT